jgi:translation initiation factor eIF-2B subunit delta
VNLDEVLQKADADVTSGASLALVKVLDDLLEVVEGQVYLGPEAIERFALRLQEARGSMAPIFHLCNSLLLFSQEGEGDLERLRGELRSMRERELESTRRIAHHAASILKGGRFLVISRSSAVNESLVSYARVRDVVAYVMESFPGGEGGETARYLAENGLTARVISDSMVFEVARTCDAGICGADSLSPGGVLNKVGTYSLAAACQEAGIPLLVLAGESKLLPFVPDEMMRSISLDGKVMKESQVFELTPFRFFHAWVSEGGLTRAAEIASRCEGLALARALKKAKGP